MRKKRILALALSALLAVSPAMVYAEDAIVFYDVAVEEQGFAQDNEVSFDEDVVFDEEEVGSDEAAFFGEEETVVEETTDEDETFSADFFGDATISYDGEQSEVTEEVVTDDASLADTITITYDLNGGTATPGTKLTEDIAVAGTLDLLDSLKITRTDYTLDGWSGSDGITYNPGQSKVVFTKNTTLTAIWKAAEAGVVETSGTVTPYPTLAQAISKASSAHKVRLLTDVVLDAPLALSPVTLTIDLNGKTITEKFTTNQALVTVSSGTVTIMNSSSTGSIINTKGDAIAVSGGTLVIGEKSSESITITGLKYAVNVSSSGAFDADAGTYSYTSTAAATSGDPGPSCIYAGGKGAVRLLAGTYSGEMITTGAAPSVSILTSLLSGKTLYTPDNYLWVDKASGLTVLTKVSSGITGLESNDVVKLYKDVERTASLEVKCTTTLDLNGHKLSNAYSASSLSELLSVASGKELTVIDSKGGGSIVNYGNYAINNAGTLVAGKSSSDSFTIKGKVAAINSTGTLTINGGKYEGETEGVLASGTVDIKAGTYTGTNSVKIDPFTPGTSSVKVATSIVDGGKVDVPDNCVWSIDGSTATLDTLEGALNKGGTVKLTNDVDLGDATVKVKATVTLDLNGKDIKGSANGLLSIIDGGNLTINDSKGTGSIVSTGGNAIIMTEAAQSYDARSLTFNAGTFTGKTTSISVSTGTLTVNSGIFTQTIYVAQANGQTALTANFVGGSYKPSPKPAIKVTQATIGTQFSKITIGSAVKSLLTTKDMVDVPADYIWVDESGTSTLKSLSDAFAKSGQVKLAAPLALKKEVSVTGADVTLDLNGNAVTEDSAFSTTENPSYLFGVASGSKLTVISTGGNTAGSITTTKADTAFAMNPAKKKTGTAALVVGAKGSSNNYLTIDATKTKYAVLGVGENTDVTINAGTLKANVDVINNNENGTSKVTVAGGSLTSTIDDAIIIGSGTTFEATGGTITANNTVALYVHSGYDPINVTISGGTFSGVKGEIYERPEAKNVTMKIVGGNFKTASEDTIKTKSCKYFIEGGNFRYDLSKTTNYISKDCSVVTQAGEYGYKVVSDVSKYVLTLTSNLSSAKITPESGEKYGLGKTVSITASAAPSGYEFGGWFNGSTKVSSSLSFTYTMPASATTLEARYLKQITVTANDDTVATGTAYSGSVSKVTVTGLLSGDSNVLSSITLTASTYNKDTSAIGSKHTIVPSNAVFSGSYANKYVVKSYSNGTLTVIEGTGPDAFIADVAKLVQTITPENLAEARAAVDKAKADYDKLSTASKDLADVKAAKAKLDENEKYVKDMEAEKAEADKVTALIEALPAADKVTADNKDEVYAAQDAFDKLTALQKSFVPATDKQKLSDCKAAADKAGKSDKDIADEVNAMIAALPSPDDATINDRAAVDAAKAAYEALTENQKALVTPANKNKLADVDKAVSEKEAEADKAAADAVMALIEAIPKVEAGAGKDATVRAREAFEALTPTQREYLPKSAEALLEDAEEAYKDGRIFGLNGNQYKVLSNGDVTYHRPQDRDSVTSISVPNQIRKGGYSFKVIKISINAFNSCPNLVWVVVGKNIKTVGNLAFKGTPKLKKIKFMGTNLTKVTSAFNGAGVGKGSGLTVLVPQSKIVEYSEMFFGAGKLSDQAKVSAA